MFYFQKKMTRIIKNNGKGVQSRETMVQLVRPKTNSPTQGARVKRRADLMTWIRNLREKRTRVIETLDPFSKRSFSLPLKHKFFHSTK